MINVKLPDGRTISVETDDPKAAAAAGRRFLYNERVEARAAQSKKVRGTFGAFSDRAADLVGLNDEVAGVAEVIGNVAEGLFKARRGGPVGSGQPIDIDIPGSFQFGRDVYKAEQRNLERDAPLAAKVATGVSIATGVALPTKALAGANSLGQVVRQGATQGAVMGALTGGATAEGGLGQRALGAGAGALAGGALGAAIPVGARGLGATYRGVAGMMGKGANAAAPKILADAMRADGISPAQAGAMIDAGQANGVPLALMDVGDNLRGTAASVGRKPGPSQTIIRDAAIARQEGQTDRIAGAISRDLGPVANPREVGEQLMASAKAKAGPLYDEAYATPTPVTDKLAGLIRRLPRAVAERAQRIAAIEGRDPNAVRLDFDETGSPMLGKQMSMETLDFLKRGLDDLIDAFPKTPSGRPILDGEGRALNNLRKALIAELDRVNPAYGKARAAYAGDASMAEALERGRNVLNKTADDLYAMTRDMTPAELDQFRLGVRAAMVRAMEARGDYADKVRQLVGSPQKRAALEKLFGGRGDFQRFMATLADEKRAQETYAAVAGNSATAGRQAFDEATGDQGLVMAAGDAALGGGGTIAALMAGLRSAIKEARNNRVGKVGEEVRAQLAAALSEADPAVLRRALRDAQRARAAERVAARPRAKAAIAAGRGSGVVAGQGINALVATSEQP